MEILKDFIDNLLAQTNVTVLAAVLTGLLGAVGPCTMATNVACVAYISRRITDRKFAILASLLYALGRMLTYTLIGILILSIGVSALQIGKALREFGSYALGPILILGGLLMLFADKFSFGGGGGRLAALGNRVANWGLLGAFLMGVIFALAFCPYVAVLFFAVLIPMALTAETGGIFLPGLFAIGNALPVILFGIMIAAGVSALSGWIKNLERVERKLRIVMAVVFIIVGVYYLIWV